MNNISRKNWILIWVLGMAGQICWNIENSWFNNFVYDKIAPEPAIVSWMVGVSAVVSTFCTFLVGTWGDRIGKRKPFIWTVHFPFRSHGNDSQKPSLHRRRGSGAGGRRDELFRLAWKRRRLFSLDHGYFQRAKPWKAWRRAGSHAGLCNDFRRGCIRLSSASWEALWQLWDLSRFLP